VRNIARLTISMFGGADCRPMPCAEDRQDRHEERKAGDHDHEPGQEAERGHEQDELHRAFGEGAPSPSEIEISCARARAEKAIQRPGRAGRCRRI
jgi:hypothetical protein